MVFYYKICVTAMNKGIKGKRGGILKIQTRIRWHNEATCSER